MRGALAGVCHGVCRQARLAGGKAAAVGPSGCTCGLLGLVALTGTATVRMKAAHRLVCLCVVAIASTSIFIGMWCAEVPPDYRDGVLHGVGHVPGVQGRYFIPFALPLLLVFSNTLLRVNRKWLLAIAAMVIVTVNAVALEEDSQHLLFTRSGMRTYYENKLVKQFGLDGNDAKVYVIHSAARSSGSRTRAGSTSHGYHWPDDVLTIFTGATGIDSRGRERSVSHDRASCSRDHRIHPARSGTDESGAALFCLAGPASRGEELGRRVVEVGCGVGNFTRHLLDRELVVALDVEADCVCAVSSATLNQPSNVIARQLDVVDPAFVAAPRARHRFDRLHERAGTCARRRLRAP